jgi:hypothetical protein
VASRTVNASLYNMYVRGWGPSFSPTFGLSANPRFIQASNVIASQIYVASDAPRCTSSTHSPQRETFIFVLVFHRRTGEPNSYHHLFHQRAVVVSWHESLLCLAEPSACTDLGRHVAQGKSLDGDGMPEMVLTRDRFAGESALSEHHHGRWE